MCSVAEKPPVENLQPPLPQALPASAAPQTDSGHKPQNPLPGRGFAPSLGKFAAATAVESGRKRVSPRLARLGPTWPDLARFGPPSVVYVRCTLKIAIPCFPAVSTCFLRVIPVLW